MSVDPKAVSVAEVAVDVFIEAPRERVWRAIVEETGSWWPAEMFASPRALRFVIEPHPGGRIWEDWGDGNGLVWGMVVSADYAESLRTAADLWPEYGGPARSMSTWRLSDDGESTRLIYRETLLGRLEDSTEDALRKGWRHAFEGCLKPWVESGGGIA